MKELKCPKCGNAFTVDEADYAFILQQVKTSEFNAEVEKRLAELRAGEAAQRELALAEQKAETTTALDAKEREIASLKLALQTKESEAKHSSCRRKPTWIMSLFSKKALRWPWSGKPPPNGLRRSRIGRRSMR